MSEDKETKVKDETVLTESEKQEQILRVMSAFSVIRLMEP